MELVAFFDAINGDEQLSGGEIYSDGHPDGDYVTVAHTAKGAKWRVTTTAIHDYDWCDLRAVLVGEREAMKLHHVTRVCGYMAHIENFNPSKVGEVHDRRNGDYRIGGEPQQREEAAA